MTRDEAMTRLMELVREALQIVESVDGAGYVDMTAMTNEYQSDFRALEPTDDGYVSVRMGDRRAFSFDGGRTWI